MFSKRNDISKTSDASLVMDSLGGDRHAFCTIVSRYQTLLCSIAYSSVGDIKQSEDIAQEAFVEAWRKLDSLRDPERLKSWLCGILRFKVSHYYRKEHNQPLAKSEEIDATHENQTSSEQLDEVAIQNQHETLMWETLDGMDTLYREPLVLFYREQQSITRVAEELELSEELVKQRLSRGRKLLKRAMSSLVEDALEKSKPGAAFTAAVLSIISNIAPPSATAATLGAGVGTAKASSYFSLSFVLTLLGSMSGFISAFFGLQAGLYQSRTEREKALVKKTVIVFVAIALLFVAAMFVTKYLALTYEAISSALTFVSQLWVLLFVVSYVYLSKAMLDETKALRDHERLFNPSAFEADTEQSYSKRKEYISRASLLGVPIFHFQFGMPESSDKPARAWIAGGAYAQGLLFAWGSIAFAPICVGIVSVGIVSIGAVGIGVISMGTVALGLIAFGASAVGYKAYSSLSSLGVESALSGGFAVARDAAVGHVAFANQVNNETAFNIAKLTAFSENYPWALATIALFVIVPAYLFAKNVKKRMNIT